MLLMCCILSKFYIKPQHVQHRPDNKNVVSYRNSTSNHNNPRYLPNRKKLYLIEILHQTTTKVQRIYKTLGCILSKFYIKPQPVCIIYGYCFVVSYRNSTSNHNTASIGFFSSVLYLIEILHQTTTTSSVTGTVTMLYLIEILHQTTTWSVINLFRLSLYLIEILHQTTTSGLILIDKVLLTGCLPL